MPSKRKRPSAARARPQPIIIDSDDDDWLEAFRDESGAAAAAAAAGPAAPPRRSTRSRPAKKRKQDEEEDDDLPQTVTAWSDAEAGWRGHGDDGCPAHRYRSAGRTPFEACDRRIDGGWCCRKCPPHTAWSRTKWALRCTESRKGGFCCPMGPPMHETKEDVRRRRRLPLVPTVADADLETLSKPIREEIFGDDKTPWRVYEVDRKGDCFYDCIAKAYNSVRVRSEMPLTVADLRWRLANHVTVHDAGERLRMAIDNIPAGLAAREPLETLRAQLESAPTDVKRSRVLENIRALMMHRTYWATAGEVADVSEDDGLDLVPIIVNADFHNRRIRDPVRKLLSEAPFMMYPVSPARAADARRYVLLFNSHTKDGEDHYQLLVRADKTSRGHYRAVWRRSELPEGMHATFVHYAS